MRADTSERILDCAIELFAERGYDGVSMRQIAAAVGIKASSLYKHFLNKEAILESVFEQFRAIMQSTHAYEVEKLRFPEGTSAAEVLKGSFLAFRDLVYQPRLMKITRVINREQSRNKQVRDFFVQELVEKPLIELEETFSVMIAAGMLKTVSPHLLAKTYHAYILSAYYTHNILQAEPDLPLVEAEMLAFIDFFCETYAIKG